MYLPSVQTAVQKQGERRMNFTGYKWYPVGEPSQAGTKDTRYRCDQTKPLQGSTEVGLGTKQNSPDYGKTDSHRVDSCRQRPTESNSLLTE